MNFFIPPTRLQLLQTEGRRTMWTGGALLVQQDTPAGSVTTRAPRRL
jgi:hypothetical protein